jgi:glycosyltransferase involved in cell wall biosynthesis
MKVLYLITRAERGGAQVHLLDLIRGFRELCDVELAAGEEGFLVDEARHLGVNCHIIPGLVQPIQPGKDLRAFWEIVALFRKTRPDVVHVHTSKAGILGRLGAWICGTPAIYTAHTWCFAEGTSKKWKVLGAPCERLAALPGGLIINVSEANRKLALEYRVAPADRLVTIHNGVPDEPRDVSFSRPSPPAIIMVARFAKQKNQKMLLEVCSELRAPFRLWFAGGGPMQAEVERRAKQLGMRDRVEFLGDCSDVSDRLRQASIFALATNWEGFPLSVLEAMRAGLPIVASDVGGVSEAVIDGDNGFLIERDDKAEFRRALETLLTDDDLRRRMARKSRDLFQQRFTAEQMLRRTFNIYCESVSAVAGGRQLFTTPEGAASHSQRPWSKR